MILRLKTIEDFKKLKENIYLYKKHYRELLDESGNIKFGCEIEFNTDKDYTHFSNKNINADYEVTIDCSGYDVIEIISPILKNTKKDWESMKDVLSNIDGTIKSTVGGHIHFDNSIIDDSNLVYFLKLWYVFEETIYKFASGDFNTIRKSSNYYAKKLGTKLKNLIDNYENGITSLSDFGYFDKYYGLNMTYHLDLSKYIPAIPDTYEVRVPNGSLNIETWQNNVEFFACLFKFANNPLNKILINDLYNKGKLESTFKNDVLLSNIIYTNDESRIRFLNQLFSGVTLPIGKTY